MREARRTHRASLGQILFGCSPVSLTNRAEWLNCWVIIRDDLGNSLEFPDSDLFWPPDGSGLDSGPNGYLTSEATFACPEPSVRLCGAVPVGWQGLLGLSRADSGWQGRLGGEKGLGVALAVKSSRLARKSRQGGEGMAIPTSTLTKRYEHEPDFRRPKYRRASRD